MLVENLKNELKHKIGNTVYDNYCKELKYTINEQEHKLKILIPAEHIKQYLLANRFIEKYKRILSKLTSEKYEVFFHLSEYEKVSRKDIKKEDSFYNNSLNRDYTFNTYIVGESNEVAYSATYSITETPGEPAYNPLFIYGGVGLGKTHLLHSIGNQLKREYSDMRIINLTSFEFMHQYTKATKDKKVPQLIEKFRKNCDILLIDDIQFLSQWRGTQTHFFHIFNQLRDANKQIVMTSDRTPQEIPDIEERLRSRFEWGLVTEVGIPVLETRKKIINEKAKVYNLILTEDMITYLADKLRTNIREIEGVLKKINALVRFAKKEITIDLLENVVREHSKRNQKKISIELIRKTVGKFYDVTVDDLVSNKRKKEITVPRQISMYLIKELTKNTHKEIGKAFNRDHSTVVNSLKKVKESLENDVRIEKEIKELKRILL